MINLLSDISLLVTTTSRKLISKIKWIFSLIVDACRAAINKVWTFYHSIESFIVSLIANSFILIYSLRQLVSLLAFGFILIYFKLWWWFIAYTLLLSIAIYFILKDKDKNDKDKEEDKDKQERITATLSTFIRWPVRIFLSLSFFFLSWHFSLLSKLGLSPYLQFNKVDNIFGMNSRVKPTPRASLDSQNERDSTSLPSPDPKITTNKNPLITRQKTDRVESNLVLLGSVYITETFSLPKPSQMTIIERKVTSVESGKFTISALSLTGTTKKPRALEFTNEGNLLSIRNTDGSGLNFTPPIKYYDFPLFPRKTWQEKTIETNIMTGYSRQHILSGTVGEWEIISVPAGTFEALKVSITTELVDIITGEKSDGTDVSWYVPEVGRSVKSITSSRKSSGDEQYQIIQLRSYKLGEKLR